MFKLQNAKRRTSKQLKFQTTWIKNPRITIKVTVESLMLERVKKLTKSLTAR
jgi:hypothetical protein